MSLARNPRIDRRRRVMLDSISQDAELAVENVRARRKARDKKLREEDEDYDFGAYRDPGYSQAVRRACQQRLVQLIPVRRATVAIVLCVIWGSFLTLLLAHYMLFADPSSASSGSLANLPISHLFHLRSPHGIGHWVTCQLWLLTGVVCWMVFNLRRHKLDDYRARYRIWIGFAIAAFFSSFDASTSVLQLVGASIDSWTRTEIGYGGWPLVLAAFASLIGVLGIRLSSELKTVPLSVVSWLLGLFAWAASALLGTGLLKVELSPEKLDFLVGALWLGGVLAVFQSVSMYLRATYIQAQKRFLQRNGCELGAIQWQMPKIRFGLNRSGRARNEAGWDDADESETENASPRKSRRKKAVAAQTASEDVDTNTSRGRRLFGLIPDRHLRNESLEDEPIAEDEGGEVDLGLTKKRGWFGIGGNKEPETTKQASSTPAMAKSSSEPIPNSDRRKADSDSEDEVSGEKQRWWKRKTKDAAERDAVDSDDQNSGDAPKKRGLGAWRSQKKAAAEDGTVRPSLKKRLADRIPKLPKRKIKEAVAKSVVDAIAGEQSAGATKKQRKPLIPWKRSSKAASSDGDVKAAPKNEKDAGTSKRSEKLRAKDDDSPKKGWFGFLDNFKLKPPTTEEVTPSAKPQSPQPATNSSTTPVPIKSNAALPSTTSYDEDDDDDYNSKPMSKAERKRLRRQQDDRRAG